MRLYVLMNLNLDKMSLSIILAAIVLLVLIYVASTYNRLVRLRTHADEAWSGISVQLKKRHDLIPNLVETVKGFAAHERETFESVTQARTAAMQAGSVEEQAVAESNLNRTLGRLFAISEAYPELRSNQNFLHLQGELTVIESDLEKSRRYYNGAVRNKNIAVESFPSNMIANIFNFTKSEFFELDSDAERAVPKITF